ncbi:hypothetical protein O181_055847 [Austropuccinia psidii MF-1]|uniref:Reverse transcriptase/retrotransposon-derived protein RNase H-like domain-containing protein n=1 Tax=Austropuccinia psidii MF-1 TaxID=1389203 RepID=A0A9Q3HTX0_9BASI|nr:hypothetical protein [Austropuccinia psidii MF-1]
MDYSKVQQILNWRQPKRIKVFQSFLGVSNLYQCVIKNYLKRITSLTSIYKNDSPFILNEDALSKFQILKDAFPTAPILSHFNPSLPTFVGNNSSDYALGAVLSQLNDSGKYLSAFYSYKLFPAELNYAIQDKELLGIVLALKCWRDALPSFFSSFEILKDHYYLQYCMSFKALALCQSHWAQFLFEFHFTISYHPGWLATLPDALLP